MFCLVTVSIGRLNDHASVKYGVIVKLGEVQTIPCEYLFCGKEDGVIMVALLLTTPWALLLGLATVVFAKTFTGLSKKIIVQRQRWFLWLW